MECDFQKDRLPIVLRFLSERRNHIFIYQSDRLCYSIRINDIRLSDTGRFIGAMLWMDVNNDGELGTTFPPKQLLEMINSMKSGKLFSY